MDPITTSIVVSSATSVLTEALRKDAVEFLQKTLRKGWHLAGGLFADQVNEWRKENALITLGIADQRLRDAGVEPAPIPPKIYLRMLEEASLEEAPDLRELWANLIANAADPRKRVEVTGQYASILRDLSASDARFFQIYVGELGKLHTGYSNPLDNAAYQSGIVAREPGMFGMFGGYNSKEEQQAGVQRIALTIDNLCRAGLMEKVSQVDAIDSRQIRDLIEKIVEHHTVGTLKLDTELTPGVTELGRAFYEAMQPPSKS